MIAELKPYPTMKDSGVEWLGKVPEHWEVRRGKNIFGCIDVRSNTGKEELLTVSSKRGVIFRRSAKVTMFKAESYIGYKLCWPNDLVINSLWAWACGLGVSKYHGVVSTAYSVYRPNKSVDPKFIHEFVRSTSFHWELRVRSKGIWTSRLQLTDNSFLCAPFPLPPLAEQAAIVRYLDYMGRRIRRYIGAKQKLIKLLEEQKQVIIHRAVTRGLKPDVPLKDSNVKWLGKVPEHWEVKKLKTLSRKILNGSTPPTGESAYYAKDGIPWYGPPSLGISTTIGQPTRCLSINAIKKGTARLIVPPALAISVIGNVGKCALLLQRGATNQQITCFELINILCDPHFIIMQFRLAEQNLTASASSATIAILDSRVLKATKLALPPLPEQAAIVKYLDKATANIDTTIARARREIKLLNEYRIRLSSDVVTGKLDVREVAAGLPDEVDEPQGCDGAEEPMDENDSDAMGVVDEAMDHEEV